MTTLTPEQLLKYANDIERHQSTVAVEGCDPAWMAARLRDLAAAQEELASVKAHAEAMADFVIDNPMGKETYRTLVDLVYAYRRDFPKDAP